jgi:hypothetical protein
MKKKKQIRKIMENFNFRSIEEVMRYRDWQWYNKESQTSVVPSIVQLEEAVVKRLEEAWKQWKEDGQEKCNGITWISSTGGFRAECTNGLLRLAFELEDWETY